MTYAEYGGSRSGFLACGVASQQLVPFNGHRRKLVVCNDAANACYLFKGNGPAIANAGLLLLPGGVLIIQPDTQGYLWKGAISCISLVAAQNLTWQEDW